MRSVLDMAVPLANHSVVECCGRQPGVVPTPGYLRRTTPWFKAGPWFEASPWFEAGSVKN